MTRFLIPLTTRLFFFFVGNSLEETWDSSPIVLLPADSQSSFSVWLSSISSPFSTFCKDWLLVGPSGNWKNSSTISCNSGGNVSILEIIQ